MKKSFVIRRFVLIFAGVSCTSEHSYTVLSPGRVDSGCFGVNSIPCPDPFYPTVTCHPAPCQIVDVLVNNPESYEKDNPGSGAWAGGGPMKYITYAMLRRINEAQKVLPGYEVRITYQDDGCNSVQSVQMLAQQLIDNPKLYVAFGGTSCSDTAKATADILPLFRMPHIGWACSSQDLSDREKYPDFFRTRVADTGGNPVWLKIMERIGWVKVGVVYGLTSRFASHHEKLSHAIVAAQESGQKITVVYDEQVLALDADTRRVVTQLIRGNSRVMIVLAYAKVMRAIMCHGHRRGVKGIIIMTIGWHAASFVQDQSEPDMTGSGPSDFTCTLAEMNDIFMNAVIATNGDLWSSNMNLNTSCVPEETPASLKYWFEKIGIGGSGYEADGTTYVDQISAGMDGMCTILLMLHEMLVNRGRTLAELQDRSKDVYEEIKQVLSATNFIGVSSRTVEFTNGDLNGGISILQTGAETPYENVVWVALGKYEQGVITFSNREIMWPDGSSGFSRAPPDRFPTCVAGSVNYLGVCRQCDPGKASMATAGSTTQSCINCETGKYTDLPGQTTCNLCPSGSKSVDNEGERSQCEACVAGRFNSQLGAMACMECQAGKHGNAVGMMECDLCGPGYFSVLGALECFACDAGYYTDLYGTADGCAACQPGTYTSQTSQTACQRCPIGTYADSSQATGCFRCHDHVLQYNQNYAHDNVLATSYEGSTSYSDCRCESGTYRSRDDPDVCYMCPPASDCLVGSLQVTNDSSRAPKLKEGYMAYMVGGSLEIFRCRDVGLCKDKRRLFQLDGNWKLDSSCLSLSEGQACATCKDGAYSRNGQCRSCSGLPVSSPIVLAVVTLATIGSACLAFYYESMFPPNPVTMALGGFFTLLQSVSVIAGYSVILSELTKKLMALPSELSRLDLTAINLPPQCVQKMEFVTMYALQVFWVTELWLMFGFIFLILQLLHRLLVTVRPDKKTAADWLPSWHIVGFLENYCRNTASGIPLATRLGWFFRATSADIINAVVKATNILYITIAKTSMAVFRVEEHPSGIRTLYEFPDVVVGSQDWWGAMLISGVGLVVFCAGFLAFFAYLVICAPHRLPDDPTFRVRFRGLWAKFDPSSWWFGIVHLLYGLVLNITPACLQNARAQIIVGSLINSCYILVACHVQPWRWQLAHRADVILRISFACFLFLTMGGNVGDEIPAIAIHVLMSISIIFPACYVLLILIRYVWMYRFDKLSSFAQRAAFTQKFLDLSTIVDGMSVSHLRAMTTELLDRDVQSLDHALDSLQYALLGLQPNSIFRRRAGLKPFEICRPGRLEGELLARGLEKKGDCRADLRLLQEALRSKASIFSETGTDSCNSWRTLSDVSSHLVHSKFERRMRSSFKLHVGGVDGEFGKVEFCNFILKALGLDHWTGPHGETISKPQLEDIFDYISVNQGKTLTPTEFLHAIRDLPDPIFPRDYQPKAEHLCDDSPIFDDPFREQHAEYVSRKDTFDILCPDLSIRPVALERPPPSLKILKLQNS